MICRTRLHDLHAVTCTVARSCRQLPALFVLAFSSSHTNSRHSSLLPVTCLFSDRTPLLFVTFHYFYPPPSCIYALALTTLPVCTCIRTHTQSTTYYSAGTKEHRLPLCPRPLGSNNQQGSSSSWSPPGFRLPLLLRRQEPLPVPPLRTLCRTGRVASAQR